MTGAHEVGCRQDAAALDAGVGCCEAGSHEQRGSFGATSFEDHAVHVHSGFGVSVQQQHGPQRLLDLAAHVQRHGIWALQGMVTAADCGVLRSRADCLWTVPEHRSVHRSG